MVTLVTSLFTLIERGVAMVTVAMKSGACAVVALEALRRVILDTTAQTRQAGDAGARTRLVEGVVATVVAIVTGVGDVLQVQVVDVVWKNMRKEMLECCCAKTKLMGMFFNQN